MELFKSMQVHGHEQVAFWYDKQVGLKAIIAIHDTTLGPALGGARMWPYASEAEALQDALRLAEGMTYKASVVGLDLGGGKAVILGDPATDKSETLFRSFGRFVNSLNGRYITAEDVGTGVKDMAHIKQETRFVVGLPSRSGDPSPLTALGVFQGIKACCRALYGADSLTEKTVAVQGVGKVGLALVEYLCTEEARVIVADVNQEALKKTQERFKVEVVEPDQIYRVTCDIFAPCALGAILNDSTIPQLTCAIVAGAANNQLAELRHGDELHKRGILYAPDYVINAGGLINVASELGSYSLLEVRNRVAAIYDTVYHIIRVSKTKNTPTYLAAQRLALHRIEQHKHHPAPETSPLKMAA